MSLRSQVVPSRNVEKVNRQVAKSAQFQFVSRSGVERQLTNTFFFSNVRWVSSRSEEERRLFANRQEAKIANLQVVSRSVEERQLTLLMDGESMRKWSQVVPEWNVS